MSKKKRPKRSPDEDIPRASRTATLPRLPGMPGWNSPVAGAAARVLIGIVLLASGLPKVWAPPEEFAAVIEAYHILPPKQLLSAAIALPAAQIVLGLALVAGYLARAASAAGIVLFLTFIGALGSTVLRGIPLENCGCFAGGIHLTAGQAIGVDCVLICLALLAYRRGGAYAPLDAWIGGGKA
ncbi:MAG: MauE/DoxX family redox-associated membrane protein [Elusimicrobiota bacterium]